MNHQENRNISSQWQSNLGFIAAAAVSAVGLGNIWKFPYIAEENGGGTLVLFYLLCIVVLGLPVMIAEIAIGRTTQSSPVRAFQRLAGQRSWWQIVGALGVFAGILILSFYSVVAGWELHYLYLAIADTVVAIGACLVLFPIVFSVGLEPSAEPGLIFINLPLALLQLPFGRLGLILFFLLLLLAALTSAVSLLKIGVSFLIDSVGYSRAIAIMTMEISIYLLGIPSALSGSTGFFGAGLKESIGMSWFDAADYLTSN